VFGRSRAQIDVIRDVSDRQRALTMSTLRVTFLSSLVLELLATVSVALVAVAVGLRLLNGDVGLQTALFVLVLAPEAYLPLRLLGERYHASAEGVAAAQQVFSVLETPLPDRGARADIPDLSVASVSVQSLTVRYPGRARAALDGVTFEIAPGEAVAVVGRSGAGKSTLLRALLGFVAPESGEVWVGDAALPTLSPEAWRAHVCWLPQRPHLFAASIADNIRLACPDASDADLSRAVQSSGLAGVAAERPDGLQTLLGEQGSGLSAGERQRVALARAFLRPAPLLLLDEPTANLDGATEAEVLEAVARLIKGRTVVLAAHRPALVALADRVVDLDRVVVPA
jgi:thiol reductant ABC exporter CydD subunit